MMGGLNRLELTLCTKERGVCKPSTFQTEGRIPHFMFRFREAYVREMKAFIDCVMNDMPPPCERRRRPCSIQDSRIRFRFGSQEKTCSYLAGRPCFMKLIVSLVKIQAGNNECCLLAEDFR